MDITGIGTNLASDILKAAGGLLLKRLAQKRIHERAVLDVYEYLADQEIHADTAVSLRKFVDEKKILEHCAGQDIERINVIVAGELRDAGCANSLTPIVSHAVIRALLMITDRQSGSVAAQQLLQQRITPELIEAERQLSKILSHPVEYSLDVLSDKLREGDQRDARLVIGHDGQLQVAGIVTLHFIADDHDPRAQAALPKLTEQLQKGRPITISNKEHGSIRLTSGNKWLDDRLALTGRGEIRIKPEPVKMTFVARSGGERAEFVGVIEPAEDGSHFTITFVDQPGFVFRLLASPKGSKWTFMLNPQHVVDDADRDILKFLTVLCRKNAQLIRKGATRPLFAVTSRNAENIRYEALFWLGLLDLREHISLIGGGVMDIHEIPTLSERELEVLDEMSAVVQGRSIGIGMWAKMKYTLDPESADALVKIRGNIVEVTHNVVTRDNGRFKLERTFRVERVTVRVNGKHIPRTRWPDYYGQKVDVKLDGTGTSAELIRGED
ncbi:hypothetical protein [Deinococcus soli (ex Cha et al. 2016)]|uniref:Uncharacterized protein n=1 Tax=Deinococcus soli (ex Cha et al. 2016) TaxID=1309411 RepID=A0ACC6KNP1_9DEIO|nr:hypothetical protein [Deinococcus soli (ex Cha et al. 2016)]MDR6330654.1 hypothetical protein [Deinococcus soli (ex Cha et al. 2016)]MDR6754021.1 hypothetical protein [Deinococcus soli (ex Cha et al. 2016)]